MKKIVYILLAAVALAGIIFGVVKLSDNNSLRAKVDELNQQIETITADATAAYYEAKANMETAVKAAQDEAQSTIDALTSQVEELTKAAEEAARQAADTASDVVEDVTEAVTDTVEDAAEAVTDVIEDVTGAAEETAEEAAALAEADADPVLVTYDGEEIRLSQVDNALYNMYQNGYVNDLSDYDTAIKAVLQDKVLSAKIEELGLNQFTPEEEEALRADAEAEWQDALDTYVSYFLMEDTDEARAAAYQEAELYYNAYGYDVDKLTENYKINAAYDKLEQYILENKELSVSDEEINDVFNTYAESDRQMYENSIYYYEYYVLYYGYDTWYVPEGYRSIIHILLKADDTLLAAYSEAQALYEENPTDENKAAVDAAKAAIIASKQDIIDDIYARLEKGESFVSLIAAYGEDPGMQDEAQLAEGYQVHRESILWDPAFVEGAFSEKMLKPGDISDPVVGTNGVHILYYLRDIPGGIVELDDAIKEEITSYLLSAQQNEVLSAAVAEWTAEHEIVYNQDAIDAAKAQ